MGLTANIRLPSFDSEFNANIKREFELYFIRIMPTLTGQIKIGLKSVLIEAITSSAEYLSLTGGTLRGELGLQDPFVIDAIIEQWAEGIQVTYKPKPFFGVIKIGMIESSYSDVLTMPEASYTYIPTHPTFSNGIIDWLSWLLLKGSDPIIKEHEFALSNNGRTGLGIMVERKGKIWSVPAEFAGTATDNFVTRALEGIEEDMQAVIQREISKVS